LNPPTIIAKSNLISQQILDLSSGLDLGRSFLAAQICNQTDFMTYPLRIPSLFLDVTVDRVNSILRKYIDPWSLIRVTVGPNPLDMGNWTVPSKIVLPELPSRVDASEGADVGVTRSVCYDGVATPYSAKDFWLNSYGNVKGKLSGTFSWSAPEKRC